MPISKPATLIGLLITANVYADTQVYKWTDAQGQVHYSDVAPLDAKNLTQKSAGGNIIETDSLPFQSKMAAQKNPITLFSFKECGEPCSKAEKLLNDRGIPFTLKSADPDKDELKKLTGDTNAPALMIGTQKPLVGFEAGSWNNALDSAGYPKSNPLKNLKKAPAGKPEEKTAPAQN